jgi:phage-related protein
VRLAVWPSLAANIPTRNRGKGRDGGVFEVVEDHRRDTYRAVYTVRFECAVYVLHAFQKKSPRGIRTAKTDVQLVTRRLNQAKADYEVRYAKEKC